MSDRDYVVWFGGECVDDLDWRDHNLQDELDDDSVPDPLDPYVVGILGFDPSEADDTVEEAADINSATPTTLDPSRFGPKTTPRVLVDYVEEAVDRLLTALDSAPKRKDRSVVKLRDVLGNAYPKRSYVVATSSKYRGRDDVFGLTNYSIGNRRRRTFLSIYQVPSPVSRSSIEDSRYGVTSLAHELIHLLQEQQGIDKSMTVSSAYIAPRGRNRDDYLTSGPEIQARVLPYAVMVDRSGQKFPTAYDFCNAVVQRVQTDDPEFWLAITTAGLRSQVEEYIAEVYGTPVAPATATEEAGLPTDRVLLHGSRHTVVGPIRASSRGRFGPGVYLTEQPSVAAAYGDKVTRVLVKGALWDVRKRLDPKTEQKILSGLHPSAQKKALESKNWYRTDAEAFWETIRRTEGGDDAASRAVSKAGFSGIEGIGDGHEVCVFRPSDVVVLQEREVATPLLTKPRTMPSASRSVSTEPVKPAPLRSRRDSDRKTPSSVRPGRLFTSRGILDVHGRPLIMKVFQVGSGLVKFDVPMVRKPQRAAALRYFLDKILDGWVDKEPVDGDES